MKTRARDVRTGLCDVLWPRAVQVLGQRGLCRIASRGREIQRALIRRGIQLRDDFTGVHRVALAFVHRDHGTLAVESEIDLPDLDVAVQPAGRRRRKKSVGAKPDGAPMTRMNAMTARTRFKYVVP